MRKRLVLIILALLFAPLAVDAQQRVDPLVASTDDPLELQQLAIQYIAGNRPRDAIVALRKSLQVYDRNGETHMWLAVAHTQLSEFDQAGAAFEKALEMNPALTEARNWYGVYWAGRGDLDRAIEQYRLALEDPAYPQISRARVLVNLGGALVQKGDVEAAVPTFAEASRVGIPSNDPLYVLVHVSFAEALVLTGRPEQALGALEKLRVLPPNGQGELISGMAHRDLGNEADARDHFQQVLRLAPGSELADRALEALRRLDGGAPPLPDRR